MTSSTERDLVNAAIVLAVLGVISIAIQSWKPIVYAWVGTAALALTVTVIHLTAAGIDNVVERYRRRPHLDH